MSNNLFNGIVMWIMFLLFVAILIVSTIIAH